jgi:diacylglycerol kinase family enzyme
MSQASPHDDRGAGRTAALFVNTRSRRGAQLYPHARRILKAAGIELGIAAAVARPAELPGRVADAVAAGYDRIIVGAGDGTIATVLPALIHRPVTLGVLPLGTSNSLARALGLPRDPAGAVAVIAAGHTARIDAGRANGRYFLNTLTVGLGDAIVREAAPALRRLPRLLAYGLAVPRALARHRAFRAHLVAGGRRETVRTHQVVVANGTHLGVGTVNVPLGAGVAIDDGRLRVFALAGESRWELLRRSLLLALGRPMAAATPYLAADGLTIAADPPQTVRLDGERAGRTPVAIALERAALRVFVPADFAARHDERG